MHSTAKAKSMAIMLIILWFHPDLPTHTISRFPHSCNLAKASHFMSCNVLLENVKTSWDLLSFIMSLQFTILTWPVVMWRLDLLQPIIKYHCDTSSWYSSSVFFWWSAAFSYYHKFKSWLLQVPFFQIYDDMSLPNGVLRLQKKGGHGRHNG